MTNAIASAKDGNTIKLDANINGDITLTKLVNLDLGGKTLTGNVNISSASVGTVSIGKGSIDGNLTVEASKATVNNEASVSGTITIKDVAKGTWNENADNNTIIVDDETGITLNIGVGKTVKSLTLNQPTILTIASGATVSILNIVADSSVNNYGVVATLDTNANVEITGNNPVNITGNGNVSGGSILNAPKDGLTELHIPEFEAINVKYLAFNLMNDSGSAQKAATIEEVETFIKDQYGVKFNSNAINVEDGKISITGSLLSTADWNKVKQNGDITKPYNITVLNKDKTDKIAKISMYQDGKAVIESLISAQQ